MCRFGLIFRNQVEFRSEIATGGSRVRCYGDGVTTGGIHPVIHSRQPEIGYRLCQRPLFPSFFVNPARMSSMFLQMSYCSESFSVGNGPGRETFRGGALDRSNRPPPGQEQNACQPQKRHRENCDGNMPNHCFPFHQLCSRSFRQNPQRPAQPWLDPALLIRR